MPWPHSCRIHSPSSLIQLHLTDPETLHTSHWSRWPWLFLRVTVMRHPHRVCPAFASGEATCRFSLAKGFGAREQGPGESPTWLLSYPLTSPK